MEFLFWPVFLTYVLLILGFVIGFNRHKELEQSKKEPITKFSILVAFRNEATNLENLLNSIKDLNYPVSQYELILINDFSTDNFQPIVQHFREHSPEIKLTLLENIPGKAPKKAAINLGIQRAVYPYIVTTDADCIVPRNWLKAFDSLIQQKKVSMICAPVAIITKNMRFHAFQMLNFNSLQGATIGSFGIHLPFMCNGANLCYLKKTYYEVNGFDGNDDISSGDDIFLLEKFLKNDKTSVQYLKSESAIVHTQGQEHLHGFLQQQVRWMKKSSAYNNLNAKLIGSLIFLTNLLIIAGLGLMLFDKMNVSFFMGIFLSKMLADFLLIHKTNTFFQQLQLSFYFPIAAIIYPFFMLFVTLLALGKRFTWKGRTFRR